MKTTRYRRSHWIMTVIAAIAGLGVASTTTQADSPAPQPSGKPVGWRSDGSGRYPGATPTIHWSDLHNVVWTTPLPAAGNATPILVGDRLFLCAEPGSLLAVDCGTGKVLWERSNTLVDLVGEEKWASIDADLKEKQRVVKQFRQSVTQLHVAREQLHNAPSPELTEQVESLGIRVATLKAQIGESATFILPTPHRDLGFTSPTPVSDGKHIYILTATGVTACYDIDGNCKWIRQVERPSAPAGHTASPLIVDGKLIVHLDQVTALDPATGETIWQAPSSPRFGTAVAAKVGDKSVIVTPSGDLIRVDDGKVLARDMGNVTFSTPVVHENTVYFIESKATAVRLPATEEEQPTQLWEATLPKERFCASPIHDNGLIYAVTQSGMLSSLDAATGAIVYQQKLEVGGRVSPSLTLAGGRLYVGDESGRMIVTTAGRDLRLITTNQLEGHRASPVFIRDHLYIRGQKNLFCIGGNWEPPPPGVMETLPMF